MNASCEAIAGAALGEPPKRAGTELLWPCPWHQDKHPSFQVNTKKDCWICGPCGVSGNSWELASRFAGASPDDKPAVTAWLREHGLLKGEQSGASRVVAEYQYTDESGGLLYVVERREPKGFRQRRPDGKGDWAWNLNGTRRVLYRLPELLAAKSVLLVEGEKDAETARELGLVATCNSGGAGRWCDEYSETLRGKRVTVIADADEPGRKHAQSVASSLFGKTESLKVLELPSSKDLSEWIEKGGTREALLALIQAAPEWTPPKTQSSASGFTLTSLADLLARPDTPVDYVVKDRCVAGTVSMCVAKPKVGKSTLARNFCLAISRGEDFLGLGTKQGECIYLALEERAEDVGADFRAMGADGSELILIHAAAAPAEGIWALCDLIRERRPVLVVVDPLFRIARVRDEKAYAETYAALGPLIDAARETGTHIMILHHGGKSAKVDAIDSPLGSTALGGAVSMIFVMKRTEAYRTLQSVQRIGPDMPETVLQFDPDTRRLSIGGTREEAETQNLSVEILEFLEPAEGPKTEPDITEAVEGKTKFVRRALRQLVQQGKVSRDGAGKRGAPYLYRFSFSCSQGIEGTREQEMPPVGQPLKTQLDDVENACSRDFQESILVSEKLRGEL